MGNVPQSSNNTVVAESWLGGANGIIAGLDCGQAGLFEGEHMKLSDSGLNEHIGLLEGYGGAAHDIFHQAHGGGHDAKERGGRCAVCEGVWQNLFH